MTSVEAVRGSVVQVDIADRADILRLVESFYRRCFVDELLGPIFVDVAQLDLVAHLPTMCDFWETALFHAGLYRRNLLEPHRKVHEQMAFTPIHFQRWLKLWTGTVDELFAGEKAELAKLQARRIAGAMERRLSE